MDDLEGFHDRKWWETFSGKRGLFLEGASLVLMELPMADPRKERRE